VTSRTNAPKQRLGDERTGVPIKTPDERCTF
jgi:hypothetical protein